MSCIRIAHNESYSRKQFHATLEMTSYFTLVAGGYGVGALLS